MRVIRKFFLWIALIVLFLSLGKPASAACSTKLLSEPCPTGAVRCAQFGATNVATLVCCSTASECTSGKAYTPPPTATEQSAGKLCEFVSNAGAKETCKKCFTDGKSWTAIGCIETTPQGFITQFLTFAIGIAGGIAFLLILFGGFQMMTSAGNPERLTAGKELVGAAISGLLLIIFSLFLLRLIGFSILGIPGFK